MTDIAPDTRAYSEIRIGAPLPLDIAGNVISAIGALYPNTTMSTNTGRDALVFNIPNGDREAADERLNDIEKAEPVTGPDTDFIGFEGGAVVTSTPEEASLAMGNLAASMLVVEGAVNYLEAEVRDSDGQQYVVCAARSKGQTPHKLRLKAEAAREAAEQKVSDLLDLLSDILGANQPQRDVLRTAAIEGDHTATARAVRDLVEASTGVRPEH